MEKCALCFFIMMRLEVDCMQRRGIVGDPVLFRLNAVNSRQSFESLR